MSQTRVALVTGGARRVGRAIAQRLARTGCDIAVTYLSSDDEAMRLVDEVKTTGRRALAICADLTRPEESAEQIAHVISHEWGRLDILVNNASIYEGDDLHSATLEQGQRMWAIHVETPLLLCRHFEQTLRQHRGHVINMVDLLAERPWPQYVLYCASKAALANLTLALARQLAPEVSVNGIAPGVVAWPEDYPETDRERYLKRVPLQRTGTPDDVAALVEFLCTPATYITGQILRLDGGRSIT